MPYANVGGLDLFYYDDDFTNPWEASEVILLNHYGAGDSTLYNRWIPQLASKYRVIRWDRPGYGRSQAPGFDYKLTTQSFLDEIASFMDALGLEKVHYIGDKATTAAGIAFAAAYPERIRSLTLAVCVLTAQPVRQLFLDAADAVIAKGSWITAFESKGEGRDLDSAASPPGALLQGHPGAHPGPRPGRSVPLCRGPVLRRAGIPQGRSGADLAAIARYLS